MNERCPKISVLMGTYYQNSDIELLERSVYSILDQSLTNFEFLICDDGSSEQAVKFLTWIAKCDGRVKLVRHGGLKLLPHKLNACLKMAQGYYFARMDDDDFSHKDRFERQIKFLDSHPKISFVGSWANLIQSNVSVGLRCFPYSPSVEDFYMTQPFLHPSLVFRRNAIEAVGGYSEEARCILCEDYDLLMRMYSLGFVGANIQEPLIDYTLSNEKKRYMRHRWNEVLTRWHGFKAMGVLHKSFPYVVKPLICGILPDFFLEMLQQFNVRKRE